MNFDGGKITKWKQGDYEFGIRRFNPFFAMHVLGDLQKLIVPGVGGAIDGVHGKTQLNEIVAGVAGSLEKLSETVDGETVEKCLRILLDKNYISVKGKDDNGFSAVDESQLEAIFWNRPFDMVALAFKVFEVNYMDFTESCSVPIGLRTFITNLKQAVQDGLASISAE